MACDGEVSQGKHWRRTQACVDYIVYVHALPAIDPARWGERVRRMRALGICQDTSFGVTTVRGAWGLFQIPMPGFPELKVTFFRGGLATEQRRLLVELADILETA